MAKTIEVDLNIKTDIEPTIKNLRALKKQLRETAAGSEEFNKISMQIRDLDDAIKDASSTSDDFLGYLENADGPLGILGRGIRSAEKNFSSFNAVLKASIIGIIVAAIGGLVAAFSQSEIAMKKLEPLFIGMEKILGGIFRVMEPLLDIFIDLALRALPYVTKGIGIFYSSLFALFTFIKNAGMGAGQILKGIFTLDWNALQAGYNQLAGTWDATVKSFSDANKLFTDGSNEVTKTEKKNSTTRINIRKTETKAKEKEVSAELKAMREYQGQYEEHLKKLAELQQQYNTEIEDLQAVTEQQKLDLWYKRKKDEIDAITQSEQEKNALYALLETQRGIKQAEIEKKQREEKEKTDKETEEKRLAKEKELRDKEIADQKIAYETKKELQLKYVSTVGSIGKLLQQSAGENKDMAIAGILLEQASAVASIAINTQKNAAKLGYLSPGGIAELAGGAIGITSAIIAAKQGISAINASGVKGGSGGGGGMSAPSINAPRFNVVGANGINQVAQTIGQQNNNPIKAYVVAKDVTTAQSLDRNIVSSASM
jgi:hypothetical protein